MLQIWYARDKHPLLSIALCDVSVAGACTQHAKEHSSLYGAHNMAAAGHVQHSKTELL